MVMCSMFWSPPGSLYAEAVKSVRGYRFRRAISFSCRPLPRVPCVYLFWKAGLPSGLVATRQSSLILIGRPFRSRNKESSALFFRSFRWEIPWRRREMPPALSVPSLSEWSTPVCSFLIKAWYVFWASLHVTWTVPMKWNPSVLSSTS